MLRHVKDTFRAPKDRHSYTFDQHIYPISSPSLQRMLLTLQIQSTQRWREIEGYSPFARGDFQIPS